MTDPPTHPREPPGHAGERLPGEGVRRRAGIPGAVTEPRPRPWIARMIIVVLHGLGALPLRAAHVIGTAVGMSGAALPTPERRVTAVNLGLAFPEMDPAERRRLARRSLIETGKTFAEIGAMWTWGRERVTSVVREVVGEEHVRDVLATGRGVVISAPHLGSWELVGMYLSARYPMTTLYRPPRIREIDRFVSASRERHGARLVPAGMMSARAILRALRRGELVGMLPDQDPGEGAGVFVPFFGLVANTMALLPRVVAQSGAAVVLAYAERLPRSSGFRMHFVPASEGVYDPDLETAARTMNRDIEDLVRTRPEQYLWSYRRYRIRPFGEPSPYRG